MFAFQMVALIVTLFATAMAGIVAFCEFLYSDVVARRSNGFALAGVLVIFGGTVGVIALEAVAFQSLGL